MMQTELRIGEVASRAGVSVDTVRYYERLKLLPRAPRSEGGFRLFTTETVERVRFIKQAQDIGLSLDEIKELLTSGGGVEECQRMRDLLHTKLADVDKRMKTLREFRLAISRYLAACEDELKKHNAAARCPVIVEISRKEKKR